VGQEECKIVNKGHKQILILEREEQAINAKVLERKE
jgi:hypothetical protein